MLILALNYLAAQLLMEYAQTANEFKARLTIQRANRIFVNVHENIPLHVGFLTGAMVITTGSGHETGLAYATIVYTAARTAWLACYKGAPKPLDASNLLSLLYGTCLLAVEARSAPLMRASCIICWHCVMLSHAVRLRRRVTTRLAHRSAHLAKCCPLREDRGLQSQAQREGREGALTLDTVIPMCMHATCAVHTRVDMMLARCWARAAARVASRLLSAPCLYTMVEVMVRSSYH